jgi:predicted ribosomally synthesized peptide with nif11-like leader
MWGLTARRGRTILEDVTPTRLLKEMSEEQLKAFWEAVQADAGLQEKLSAAKDADAVVAIAKAAGFEISVEEVARAQAELNDEEVLGVAGGGDSDKRAYGMLDYFNVRLFLVVSVVLLDFF